jgi:rRNA-processing protein FCF1
MEWLVITQCCIVELYKMGKERQPAVDIAKEFERRKCNHREAIDGLQCLESVVGTGYTCLNQANISFLMFLR